MLPKNFIAEKRDDQEEDEETNKKKNKSKSQESDDIDFWFSLAAVDVEQAIERQKCFALPKCQNAIAFIAVDVQLQHIAPMHDRNVNLWRHFYFV